MTFKDPLHPRLQELIDYLEEHRRRLDETIASVPPELHARKPAPDRWSVHEVMEHLAIMKRRIASLLTKQLAAAREQGVGADMETSSVLDNYPHTAAVLDRSTKLNAPVFVVPTGTLDASSAAQSLRDAHEGLVASVRSANGVSLEGILVPHPVFGPMNLYHWIVTVGLHDDRHAAQIREAGEARAAN